MTGTGILYADQCNQLMGQFECPGTGSKPIPLGTYMTGIWYVDQCNRLMGTVRMSKYRKQTYSITYMTGIWYVDQCNRLMGQFECPGT
jgi:hypothetical protein